MKCVVHSEVDAVGYCRNCGKAMCSVCVRPVRDVLYCEDCLATVMGIPAAHPAGVAAGSPEAMGLAPAVGAGVPTTTPNPLGPSPVLAFFLGFLPGLGAFYNEQYGKGMIHLGIFLVLFITGVNGAMEGGAEAALWICVAALWIYMPIDAFRNAKAKQAGIKISDPLEDFSKGRPMGPIFLIGLGLFLLLRNFDWFPWYRVKEFWPLVLIALGVLMFRNRLERRP
jgi:cell wall-active antibiotic response 4TMS protein YvqF